MYGYLLASHIVAVICWMAGILYLIRLFVYHAEETEAVVKERFKVMEDRLYKCITLPASIIAVVLGISLIMMQPELMKAGWMHAKLGLAFGLFGLTHFCNKIKRELAQGVPYSSKKLRLLNELPTLLMILIVFLVVLRPF